MTYEDYMKLPKKSLAEELARRDLTVPIPLMPIHPFGWMCDGVHCINPQMDCINCPRKVTGGMFINTQSHTSTLKAEGNTSVTDGKPHNPSFID